MILTMDIETLPCNDSAIIADIAKTITPPGNIKLPESIAKWHTENGAQALKDAVAKTSFDGLYGRIACIAWQMNDGEVFSTKPEDSEVECINRFYDFLRSIVNGLSRYEVGFCGHNLTGFDLPFLKARSIILGIKPPPDIARAMKAKPWDECLQDTMLMWDGRSDKRVSMDKLCGALGIPGKEGFDGSMVSDEWENGNKEKVVSYCKDDVTRARAIYKRLIFA